MADPIIQVKDVHKDFRLPHDRTNSLKSYLIQPWKLLSPNEYETQHALKGISFDVEEGDFFGIVGRNGSGKSTLLKMLAQIYQPTKGSIQTRGRVVPFIELGVGFNGELSGKENVYLNGALLGFSVEEIAKKYKDIVVFAELDGFMGQKLKNYSSGMQVRLAFSIATILAESDILLIDEVLAVGDASFQKKCYNFFSNLKKLKKTVVFVSHDMSAVRQYCDKAILIEGGKIIDSGEPDKISNSYTQLFIQDSQKKNGIRGSEISLEERWGDKSLSFKKVSADVDAKKQQITLTCTVKAKKDIKNPIFGFSVKNYYGVQLLGNNTVRIKKKVKPLKKGQESTISWQFPAAFNSGRYFVDCTAAYDEPGNVGDRWPEAAGFTIDRQDNVPYIVNVPLTFKERE